MAALTDIGSMRICVRVRPFTDQETAQLAPPAQQPVRLGGGNWAMPSRKTAGTGGSLTKVVDVVDSRQLDFDKEPPGRPARRSLIGGRKYKNSSFIFDQVFNMDARQEEVYERTAKPLLEGVLQGFNATVFAFGATGCGKTHTISGSPEDTGVIGRTLRDLFTMIEADKDNYETDIQFSMIELYNEQIRDLLSDPFPGLLPPGGLKLLENEKERVKVSGVSYHSPKTAAEVMHLVTLGNEHRSTSFTQSNATSSRSHSVLQVDVTRRAKRAEVNMDDDTVYQDYTFATLSIVDLAGSERAAATRNMGERMKEGSQINKSLLSLGGCISALCAPNNRNGSRPHVPYRDSKLTRLLKFSLGGNCRTVMIVCVAPTSRDIEETHNTLSWAQRAKGIKKSCATRNSGDAVVSAAQYVAQLKKQALHIKQLEAQIAELSVAGARVSSFKQESAQRKINEAAARLTAQVNDRLPAIKEGAELRGRWGASSIAVSRFTFRRDELDDDEEVIDSAEEKAACNMIIARQNDAFEKNREVQSKTAREQQRQGEIDAAITRAAESTFATPAERALHKNTLQLHLDLQRLRLDKAVLEASEKGHRAALQNAYDALARSVIAVARVNTMMQRQNRDYAALVGVPDHLAKAYTQRAERCEGERKAILHSLGSYDDVDGQAPMEGIVPLNRQKSHEPKQHASPALRRVLKTGYKKGPGSPSRRSLSGGFKTMRFADQAGETLTHIRTFRARQSDSSFSELDTDDGGNSSFEAAEGKDEIKPLPGPSRLRTVVASAAPSMPPSMPPPPPPLFFPAAGVRGPSSPSGLPTLASALMPSAGAGAGAGAGAVPASVAGAEPTAALTAAPTTGPSAATSATGAPAFSSVPAPAPVLAPTAAMGAPLASAPASATASANSSDVEMADLPQWKKNRILMGKLNGDPPDMGSPAAGAGAGAAAATAPKPGLAGLGRPLRPSSAEPLGELRQVPSLKASLSSSLLKPTAASSAKASDVSPGGGGGGGGGGSGRRDSLSMRHDRKRPHKAVFYKSRNSTSPKDSERGSAGASVGGGPGGVRRVSGPVRPRGSVMIPLGDTSLNGLAGSRSSSLPPWK